MMKRFLITAMCAMLALPALAQEDALKDLPGYVNFGELTGTYGEPKINISIGATLIGFVSAMARNEDPAVAAILGKLKGVRVSVYSTDGKTDTALGQVDRVKKSLSSAKWEPIVQVNDEGERVQIFMKISGDKMDGLVLMAVDDEEAVFINVIGQLDPQELSQVMNRFDVDLDDALDINID